MIAGQLWQMRECEIRGQHWNPRRQDEYRHSERKRPHSLEDPSQNDTPC